MLSFLEGTLEEKNPERAVLNVSGTGYEVRIPVSTFEKLPMKGESVRLWIHESGAPFGGGTTLYAFSSANERSLFEKIKSVPKMSAKDALKILSKVESNLARLRQAISERDPRMLMATFGFTKATSEKLVLGLRNKLEDLAATSATTQKTALETGAMAEAIQTLVALGYREHQAREAVETSLHDGEKIKTSEIVKFALQHLGRG